VALTVIEMARIAANGGEDKKSGILETFAQQSQLVSAISFRPIAGNAYKWTREASLPAVAFRAVNEGYTESAGTTEERTETLKMIGGDLDVDNYIVKTGGAQTRTTHEMLKVKALAQTLGYTMVKGSVTSVGGATADPKAFDGLQARYGYGFGSNAVSTTGPNAGQLVANDGASNALSIAKLDEAILKVDRPTHILMPKMLAVRLTTKLRNSSSISTSRDEFGRIVTQYNGLPILYADANGDQAGIAFDEHNSSTASAYILSLGEDGLHMIDSGGADVRDLGEQDAKPVWRTRVEWYASMVDEFPRCVARLYNCANIAAVD